MPARVASRTGSVLVLTWEVLVGGEPIGFLAWRRRVLLFQDGKLTKSKMFMRFYVFIFLGYTVQVPVTWPQPERGSWAQGPVASPGAFATQVPHRLCFPSRCLLVTYLPRGSEPLAVPAQGSPQVKDHAQHRAREESMFQVEEKRPAPCPQAGVPWLSRGRQVHCSVWAAGSVSRCRPQATFLTPAGALRSGAPGRVQRGPGHPTPQGRARRPLLSESPSGSSES